MRIHDKSRYYRLAMLLPVLLILTACGDDDSNPVDETGDVQRVTIVVLENNTDVRIAGAHMVIDNNNDLACDTSGPGGDSGGSCTFMLKKVQHSIRITKSGYHAYETTFIVTGNTSYKYFSISNQ